MSRYIIIRAGDDAELERMVNNKIVKGFIPLGGVATHVQAGIANRLIQAMWRPKED